MGTIQTFKGLEADVVILWVWMGSSASANQRISTSEPAWRDQCYTCCITWLLQHVIVRGIEHRESFNDEHVQQLFVDLLFSLLPETGVRCYSGQSPCNRLLLTSANHNHTRAAGLTWGSGDAVIYLSIVTFCAY